MTRDPDFIGLLEEYLDDFDGSTPLPDASREFVRAQVPSIAQRAAWWPARRTPEMNATLRIFLAGAAVVVVALLAIRYLVPGGGVGTPAAPTPTVAPTPSPSREAASIVIGQGFLAHAKVTTPKPDGWTLNYNFATKGATLNDRVGFSAWSTTGVYADPCNWTRESMDAAASPHAGEIVARLIAQPGRRAGTPTKVTLGGWSATRIELMLPAGLDPSTCDLGRYTAWTDRSDPGGGNWNHQAGQTDVVYVVDVDRGPVVIDAWHNRSSPPADLSELDSLLAAMVIDFQ